MSVLQNQVIQSLDGLSDDNLQFLLDMIQRFMKTDQIRKKVMINWQQVVAISAELAV